MGELITKNETSDWLDRIDKSRNQLIESARSGNRVASAFAMAEARIDLIESLANEAISAKLLRMTDPRISMVELANNPNDQDRIRICAIAILSGFTPGDDQFAIFGGGFDKDRKPKAGKLYVKEAGFRTLFAHLGIVPEVRTGHPEFVPLGSAGKKIWRVSGSASCDYQGQEYTVDFSGDELIGLPGYETDNVAGIAAKARRRILQALWAKVSPILTGDQAEDEDTIAQTTTQPKQLQQSIPTTQGTEQDAKDAQIRRDVSRKGKWEQGQELLKSSDGQRAEFNAIWQEIVEAKMMVNLMAIQEALKQPDIPYASFSAKAKDLLRWLWTDKQKELANVAP